MSENPEQQSEVICTCTGTTKEKIIELINRGIDNLDKIESATGANTGCGSCDVPIQEIINEQSQIKSDDSSQ